MFSFSPLFLYFFAYAEVIANFLMTIISILMTIISVLIMAERVMMKIKESSPLGWGRTALLVCIFCGLFYLATLMVFVSPSALMLTM